jgi:SpoVK/Ycf46/Vps4 family AAA+-type ATPase
MANGDLLRQLFRSYAKNDTETFRSAALSIIEEERAKNHRLLADDLEKILLNIPSPFPERRQREVHLDVPKDKERGFPLVDIADFDYDWGRIVLPARTVDTLQQIAREHQRSDVLAASGLKPRQRILFYGPPGCGKTLAAKVTAGVLAYPMVTVRFDAIVSSYLGETAANLRRIFDFIQRGKWVVLFDEFDAIGKDRDNPFEHGELKRVVNTLLQLMDAFRGDSLLIAATNHEGMLDNAIWRRFEAVIPFTLPSEQDRILMLRLFLKGFDCSQLNFTTIGRRIKGASGSDIERISIDAARRAVLAGRNKILVEDMEPALNSFRDRMTVMEGVMDSGKKIVTKESAKGDSALEGAE